LLHILGCDDDSFVNAAVMWFYDYGLIITQSIAMSF